MGRRYWTIHILCEPAEIILKPWGTQMGMTSYQATVFPVFRSKAAAKRYLQRDVTAYETENGMYEIVELDIRVCQSERFQHDPNEIDPGGAEVSFTERKNEHDG